MCVLYSTSSKLFGCLLELLNKCNYNIAFASCCNLYVMELHGELGIEGYLGEQGMRRWIIRGMEFVFGFSFGIGIFRL